ncbi:hypothetical protein BU15DRAFT_42039, partial [Melanogaster broomeanus]
VRLSMLNAWAVVLSYHAGSQDIVVAEVLTDDVSEVSLVPRRIEFISATPAQDQLSIQMAQDPIHARASWDVAKEVLGEAIHSIVEIINEPEFSLFPANRRSLFRPFDTPLHLSVMYTTSGSLAFTLSFDPSAFDEQDVQCMLDHLLLAFQQLLTNPTLSRTEINLMSAKEHAFVQELPSLITINRLTAPEDPARYRYAHDLLSRQVSAHPDNIAIECDGKPVYSYAELDAASNGFARYLKDDLSVCPGDIVGLFVPQSPMAVVVIYALLKVGAAYISIDIDTPTVLFRKTIDMTNSSLFLTVESLEQKLRAMCWGQAITTIDRVTAQWSALDSTWQADQCPIGDPKTTIAYISLTSGSTGPPKKCMISHSNLVHWIVEAAPAFGRTTETRQLLAHELFWDGAVEEIFLTHYAGGTLCIAITHDIDSCLHDALVVTKATSITLSPTQGMQLDPTAYPSLQVLAFTGEPLTRFVREKWLAYGKTLLNAFGPSESICGFAVETPVHSSASNETPVGFSIGGQTRLYILYPDMKLAPIGCVGEIFVSGPSVGLGYLGDPDATAQLFVEDPFRKEFRMYRTGDFGRVNHEGRLYFIGRRDNQVWLNGGFRIELGEIEAALHAAESKWATVVEIVTYQEKRRIAAFFAPRFVNGPHILKLHFTDDAKAERLRLFEFIEPRLMKFCYPELWISVDALPCTVTGKLDRKGLKAFFHGLAPSLQDEVANFTTVTT